MRLKMNILIHRKKNKIVNDFNTFSKKKLLTKIGNLKHFTNICGEFSGDLFKLKIIKHYNEYFETIILQAFPQSLPFY